MAGYIESWGRGMEIIFEGCKDYGMPGPLIAETQEGFCITFLKDIYTDEYLQSLDINQRQVKAVLFIKESGKITNAKYQKINSVGKTLATQELRILIEKGLIVQSGSKGRGSQYELKGNWPGIGRIGQ